MLNWLKSDFFVQKSNNIFMLCHYGNNIVLGVNSSTTYNGVSNLLLTGNLSMSYSKMKETICHVLGWNYNDIEIT
jgi:hypothetical protein